MRFVIEYITRWVIHSHMVILRSMCINVFLYYQDDDWNIQVQITMTRQLILPRHFILLALVSDDSVISLYHLFYHLTLPAFMPFTMYQ